MAVVISSSLVMSLVDPDAPDLTHARIGYEKLSGTPSASSASSGFPASAANNALTYSFWKPETLPATWEIDFGSTQSMDYAGIAAHEFGTKGNTVALEVWSGTEWVEVDSTAPVDDKPIMFIFSELTISKARIVVSGGTVPRVGVVYTGMALVMERAIYGGHAPITLSDQTEYTTNASERGQWLGRSIKSNGVATSYQWANLTAAWYREYFDPFVKSARTQPFFIAWRPETFPEEVAYCFTGSNISPKNTGERDVMSVSMNAEGI